MGTQFRAWGDEEVPPGETELPEYEGNSFVSSSRRRVAVLAVAAIVLATLAVVLFIVAAFGAQVRRYSNGAGSPTCSR
jgi:hypothetical protein